MAVCMTQHILARMAMCGEQPLTPDTKNEPSLNSRTDGFVSNGLSFCFDLFSICFFRNSGGSESIGCCLASIWHLGLTGLSWAVSWPGRGLFLLRPTLSGIASSLSRFASSFVYGTRPRQASNCLLCTVLYSIKCRLGQLPFGLIIQFPTYCFMNSLNVT